jgi:hypothetical protein
MGMFDNITCQYPFPDRDVSDQDVFQTKDLDNELAYYAITKDGHLLRCFYEYVRVEGEDDAFGRPKTRRVDKGTERISHHGDIEFYIGLYYLDGIRVQPDGVRHEGNGKVTGNVNGADEELKYKYREYTARFTDGVCVWIKNTTP